MESPLVTLSNDLASLAARIAPAVVVVHGRQHTPSSGVHVREGLVVTAEHTLRRDEDISLTLPGGNQMEAHLVGRDPGTDLALLKAEGLTHPLAAATGTDLPRVGDLSLVVGRSPNSGPNASMGIISAVSGPWRTWRGGQLDAYLRLDATVFPGSAGGAVVDFRGQFLGIATDALSRVAGLAIPASTIRNVIDQLLQSGSVRRGYIGVALQSVPMPEPFQQKFSLTQAEGVMVLSLEPNGPADKAGILVGDILLTLNGEAITSVEDLQALLRGGIVGSQARLRVIRGGESRDVTAMVGERERRIDP